MGVDIVTLVLILASVQSYHTKEISLKKILLRELLSNYSFITSPGDGANSPEVNVTFSPLAVLGLDEKAQEFTFSASMEVSWFDEALAWNPEDFPGIKGLDLHSSAVWTPEIIVPSGSLSISDIPFTRSVLVLPSGRVIGLIADIFRTNCYVDVTDFPLDTQNCTFGLTMRHAHITSHSKLSDSMFKNYYTTNSEWSVEATTLVHRSVPITKGSLYFIDVSFVLQRYCTFYVVTIIFPMALLSYMNSLVFLLPSESGEKISYLLSIFVSESVFLSVASDTLARTSKLSKMSIYIVFMLSESCLALVVTLVVLNRHHGKEFCRLSCRGKNSVQDLKDSGNEAGPERRRSRLELYLFFVFLALSTLTLFVFVDISGFIAP